MSLRINTKSHPVGATLKVSGRLVGPWIDALQRSFDEVARADSLVVVDLAEMSFAAPDGIALLRRLMARGACVCSCPTYLLPQLHGVEP